MIEQPMGRSLVGRALARLRGQAAGWLLGGDAGGGATPLARNPLAGNAQSGNSLASNPPSGNPPSGNPLVGKASKAGPLISIESLGQPIWSPRDYAAFAREGFMQNAIVYRSVRMIAEAAATVPLLLYDGDREIEGHPLLDLIRRPNREQCAPDLFENFYGFLLVSGNGYVEAVALDDEIRELHVLRPDRMKVVPGSDGWPEAYEYCVAGRTARFSDNVVAGVRPILHQRMFHPVNDHYGMSPIEAAASSIDIHNAASKWNKALLDNSARPSGALVYTNRDQHLSDEQFERLKRELEDGYQGASHAGRPLLLEGGLDWKSMGLSPKDMDFIEAKHVAAREIALALGVPPMLLGIPGDNTYSNYQEATRTFWRSTVLPLVTRSAKALSGWLGPAYGAGDDVALELRPDIDAIEALSMEREALWARLEKASFLTVDEKRAAVGYGPLQEADDGAPDDGGPEDGGGGSDGGEPGGGLLAAGKFNPYHDEIGRFMTGDGAGSGGGGSGRDSGSVFDDIGSGAGSDTDDGGDSGGGIRPLGSEPDAQVQLAGGRGGGGRPRRGGGTRRVNVGNRTYNATVQEESALRSQANRADVAVRRVRELDPNWRPPPSFGQPESVQGALGHFRALAQAAEARVTVLERGGVPLGFQSRGEFELTGQRIGAASFSAGHRDVEIYLRGSAVTGYSYREGRRFDRGSKPSDFDFAIVSPSMMRRAGELGVRMMGQSGNRRSAVLNEDQLRELGLQNIRNELRVDYGRPVSFMIYGARTTIERRGPFLSMPVE